MLETWFDPAAIAIVFAGTLAATLLRCGLADCRIALAALSGLFDKPFDPAQAKAELSVQVREIADAMAYVNLFVDGPDLLTMMNEMVVKNKAAGLYDGCKMAVEEAMKM